MAGHKREGEKDRARKMEEKVRDSVWLGKGCGIVINVAVGKIPGNTETINPLKQNIIINEQLR